MNSKQQSLFNRPALHVAVSAAVLLGAALGSGQSEAETATNNLPVTAEIAASCSITATPLAFGGYDPIVTHASADLDATGTVTTICTNGSAVTITLGEGASAGAGSTAALPVRRMVAGENFLSYSLFSDSARSVVWGDTPATGVGDTGTGVASPLTVYGRMTRGQNSPVGAYTDTVIATVTF